MVNSPTGQQGGRAASSIIAESVVPGTRTGVQDGAQVDLDPAFVAALLSQNDADSSRPSGAASAGPSSLDVLALAQPILKSSVPEDDRIKLMVVLDSIDPADILSQHVSQLTGTDGGSCSLRDGLQSPHATPLALRAAINDACTSAMFASLDMSRSTLDAIDEYRHVALALIGEIETRAAKRAGQRGKGIKREEGDADLDDLVTTAPPSKKFMLHRTVGPSQNIDLFTSAANLTDDDLLQMASAPDTDLVSVLTPDFAPGLTQPTLGEVNPPTRLTSLARISTPSEPRDVAMLYYDPYASFAPSVDSTGADLGLSDSTRRAIAKSRIRAWDDLQEKRSVDVLAAPRKDADLSAESVEFTEEDRAVLQDIGADPIAFEDGWQTLQQQRAVSKTLERNADLIAELIRGRWKRLREAETAAAAGKTVENVATAGKASGQEQPRSLLDAREREVVAARQLLSSFSALLALRPRALKSDDDSPVTALPPSTAFRAFLPRLLASMEREASFAGTLDVNDARAIRDSEMVGQQLEQPGQQQQNDQQQEQLDFGDMSGYGFGGGEENDISV